MTKKPIIKKTQKIYTGQTRKRTRMIGGENFIEYNDNTERYFVLLRDAILPTDKRFHTLLRYDLPHDRIVCRDLLNANRIQLTPILKQNKAVQTRPEEDVIIVRALLKNLFEYMYHHLWARHLTHGDATDGNIIYDPINNTLVLIDWEELRYTPPVTPARDHKLLTRIVVDMINLITAIERHYEFAFNTNIWTNPSIQRILQKENNEEDNAPDGLSNQELHAVFRELTAIARMEIR